MPKVAKVVGPPGTGKTTHLLRNLERAARKYPPDRIAAISFTKAAVEEMRSRVHNVLGYSGDDLRYIRTIHSIAYRILGVHKESIVTEHSKHIADWNDTCISSEFQLPYNSKPSEMDEDMPSIGSCQRGDSRAREAWRTMDILRGRCIPTDQWGYQETGEYALRFHARWMSWLKDNDLWDFNRILEDALESPLAPELDVMFIDEAQDLSSLQIRLTHKWAAGCETAVWIGDCDQALYRFAGAVPEDFRDLSHDYSKVLAQSYRVPAAVHEYALRVIRQIGADREDPEYHPTGAPGQVRPCFIPDLSLDGTHMILCRCNYHLQRWLQWLTKQGVPWHNPYREAAAGWNPTATSSWKAARTYDQLRQGLEVKGEDLISMMSRLQASWMVRGTKTKRKSLVEAAFGPYGKVDVFRLHDSGWFQPAFFNFNDKITELFSLEGHAGNLIAEHGSEVTRHEPRVVLGTVHSVKGGESDNVWFDATTSPTIFRAVHNPLSEKLSKIAHDDECRVAYVGCTRAKHTLGILEPKGPRSPVLG